MSKKKVLLLIMIVAISVFSGFCASKSAVDASSFLEEVTEENCYKCSADSYAWTRKFYVDDFGDYTDDAYLFYLAEGKFSNTYTANSMAHIKFIIDKERFQFEMLENGESRVSTLSTDEVYTSIKTSDGTRIDLGTATVTCSNLRFGYTSQEAYEAFKALSTSEYISVFVKIVHSSGTYNTYNFKVKSNGFYNMYVDTFSN